MAAHFFRQHLDLGRAELDPKGPVEAGSYVSLRLTFTAGHPVDDTGYIKICFRQVSDFGRPQFDNPQAPNYCSVSTTGACRVTPRWDAKGHRRPWGRCIFLQVGHGFLGTGESVTITFGDRSGGSPGWQMQTFVEDTFEFKVFVDPLATYEFKELPSSPTVRVVAGPPSRAVCIAPSVVRCRTPFTYRTKREDRWGNPSGRVSRVRHPGFAAAGIHRLSVKDPVTGNDLLSNPVEARSEDEHGSLEALSGSVPQDLRPARYWADFHGQSEETVGTNTIESYYRFGNRYGCLDIVAHQGNDFQVTDRLWTRINSAARRWYRPGRLVTFPGYEWSGNTPLGGDRNIYFLTEGGPIPHSSTDLLPNIASRYPVAATADELFRLLAESPVPAFGFAHVGGRYADVRMHDPAIELAVEVHSAWGTFEWLLLDALRLGYRIGVVANSDDHKCRPGASYPGAGEFGSLGGLTCVLADKLDRESIYAALQKRHCYATTGHRPLLSVTLSAGERQGMMGDVVPAAGDAMLWVAVSGTAPIEDVSVYNGSRLVASSSPYPETALGSQVKLAWRGAEVKGRARLARWDGELKITGNRIVKATPINFWNANWPLRHTPGGGLAWRSNTTGGMSGIVLDLAERDSGSLRVTTAQGELAVDIASITGRPLVHECGGLGKQLEVRRLATPESERMDWAFQLPLTDLTDGDNPIWVRLTQTDGHLAWSSPIYLVK